MSNLVKIGNVYYVRVGVPNDLRLYINKRELKVSLKTSKKSLANKIAPPILSQIYQHFFQLRFSATMTSKPPSKRAYEIFFNRYPSEDAFVPKPYSLNWYRWA